MLLITHESDRIAVRRSTGCSLEIPSEQAIEEAYRETENFQALSAGDDRQVRKPAQRH